MNSAKAYKIAITGPESTGKSVLTVDLANHFNSFYVAEFAREYMATLDRDYTYDDILLIAQQQIANEKMKMKTAAGPFFFCDTELLVIRIWSLHKYGICDPWIDENIRKNHYDLFLLCDTDLPWQFDDQREHPHLGQYFHNWFKSELEKFGFPFRIISGIGKKRTENAINIINEYFKM